MMASWSIRHEIPIGIAYVEEDDTSQPDRLLYVERRYRSIS